MKTYSNLEIYGQIMAVGLGLYLIVSLIIWGIIPEFTFMDALDCRIQLLFGIFYSIAAILRGKELSDRNRQAEYPPIKYYTFPQKHVKISYLSEDAIPEEREVSTTLPLEIEHDGSLKLYGKTIDVNSIIRISW